MMRARPLGSLLSGAWLLALPACDRVEAIASRSPEADAISWLILGFTALLGVIWAAVVCASLLAIRGRGDTPPPEPEPIGSDPGGERRRGWIVTTLAVATGVVVLVLTGFSFAAQRYLFAPREEGLSVLVTGRQWWWDLRYEDADSSRIVSTANEIHLPVGVPVTLKLEAADVIHSVWAPALMGKIDLIPGRQNVKRLLLDRPGVYRGQCAEFCGLQHAHMGLLIVAQTRDEFERWRETQLAPARAPDTQELQAGHDAFLRSPCVMCHTVRGTDAGGRTGPDLTHLASRRTLAAGTLELTRGSIAAWISDPHGSKPGVDMPSIALAPDDLNAVAAYLASLE